MNPGEARKKFEGALNKLAYKQSLWTVFQDFLDFTLLFIRWWDRKPEDFAELEKKYPKKAQHELFAEAFMCLFPMADGYADPFGDYFMEHFSSDRKGQFFTSEELCNCIAQMIGIQDLEKGKTACDPACGSGRTLLSAAKLNPELEFYAADIDLTCCKMTVINFMLNRMSGEVAWMDTLRLEHWKSWHIRTVTDDLGNILLYYQESGAGETSFIIRLKNSMQPDVSRENEKIEQVEETSIVIEEEKKPVPPKKKKHKEPLLLFD